MGSPWTPRPEAAFGFGNGRCGGGGMAEGREAGEGGLGRGGRRRQAGVRSAQSFDKSPPSLAQDARPPRGTPHWRMIGTHSLCKLWRPPVLEGPAASSFSSLPILLGPTRPPRAPVRAAAPGAGAPPPPRAAEPAAPPPTAARRPPGSSPGPREEAAYRPLRPRPPEGKDVGGWDADGGARARRGQSRGRPARV